jgi:hypothetical protein
MLRLFRGCSGAGHCRRSAVVGSGPRHGGRRGGQSSLCYAKRVEADVGNLGRGQYPMVVEETADHSVSLGDVTSQLEEPTFPCTPRRSTPATASRIRVHRQTTPFLLLSRRIATTPKSPLCPAVFRPPGGSYEARPLKRPLKRPVRRWPKSGIENGAGCGAKAPIYERGDLCGFGTNAIEGRISPLRRALEG